MKHLLNSSNTFFVTMFAANMMMAMLAGALMADDLAGLLPGSGKETMAVEHATAAQYQQDTRQAVAGRITDSIPVNARENQALVCAQQMQEVVESSRVAERGNGEQSGRLNPRTDFGNNYFIPSRDNKERYSF
jgi:hypothetical protein